MKKIFSNRFIILISLIITGYAAYMLACTIDDWSMFYMFNPEVTKSTTYRPFYRITSEALYGYSKNSAVNDCDSLNILEWNKYFNDALAYPQLSYLLYVSDSKKVDILAECLKSGDTPINDTLRQLALVLSPLKEKSLEFLAYLKFAKKCEPLAIFSTEVWRYWEDEEKLKQVDPRKNENLVRELIAEGLTMQSKAVNQFIRQRYGFQVLRIYYYSRKFQECYNFYDSYVKSLAEGITKFRAMSYAAGALYGLGQFAQANYIFSLIYDNCEALRVNSYYGFKPVEEADWQQCLNLAKDNRQKAVLWHLLGIYKDPMRAMREIYALDSKSDLLDVLVGRYINLAEEEIWTVNKRELRPFEITYVPKAELIPQEAAQFITDVANKGNTNRPVLWNLAAAYIFALKGHYTEALSIVSKLENAGQEDVDIQRQLSATRLLCIINGESSITPEVEKKILPDIEYLSQHQPDTYLSTFPLSWVYNRLAERYRVQGDIVKAEVLDPKGRYFYDSYDLTKKMIAYMDNPVKSDFDRYILNGYPLLRESVYDFLAINEFYYGDLDKAVSLYKEGSVAARDRVKKAIVQGYFDPVKKWFYHSPNIFSRSKLLGDPFVIHINDCHDCDHSAEYKITYTKYQFVEKMAGLKAVVEKDVKSHTNECFRLANGFYNATYWGNSRIFYVTDVGHNYTPEYWDMDTLRIKPLKELPIYDLSRAKYYYKLAYDNSADKEFKAKCAFMLAKCEQNEFFRTKVEDSPIDFKSGIYFRLLKKEYSETNYYKEVIRECGYFRTFLSNK